MARPRANGNGRRLATPQSVDAVVKSICDIRRRSNCAGALQYVPELTWILFLRILDERETREVMSGVERTPSSSPRGGRPSASGTTTSRT
jgi:type I restriction enzyme M protein